MSPGPKSKERTYLREEEREVLSAILDDWSSKSDKKARDAFVSAEALPKIQDLNVQEYGPDIIAKDKVARVLWEKRVQAVYTWFKNHKPFKDRKVFRMERKISLRRVVGKMRAEELQELITTRNPDIEKGDKRYPGLYQKALTDYIAQMPTEEKKEMQETLDQWQADGPPIDVQLRAAKKYRRRGILNAHQLLSKEMHMSCITLAFVPDADTGVMGVTCHDYISSLYSQTHGKKMKTFKEWCSGGYARLVEDVIGYANYVNEQRKSDMDEILPPSEVTLESGPGQLPLLPPAVKGVREMATGSDSARTPWAIIGEDPVKFFEPECLPDGFKFQDPSRIAVQVKVLIAHLRKRQEELGVRAFHFHHVLQNNGIELAKYPDPAQDALDNGSKDEEVHQPADPPKKVIKKKKKTTRTPKSAKTAPQAPAASDDVPLDPVLGTDKVPSEPHVSNPSLSSVGIQGDKSPNGFVFPSVLNNSAHQSPPADSQPGCLPKEESPPTDVIMSQPAPQQYSTQSFIHPGWAQYPGSLQPNAGPPPFHPVMGSNQLIGFPPYPYPYHTMGYWGQPQSNDQVATSAVGLDSRPEKSDSTIGSIEYPLPPGPPPFAAGYQQFMPAMDPKSYGPGPTAPIITPAITIDPPTWTPVKKTPKRKRDKGDDTLDITPSRSARVRKPTRKIRDS